MFVVSFSFLLFISLFFFFFALASAFLAAEGYLIRNRGYRIGKCMAAPLLLGCFL
eukprot:m.157566 g.157566  ORF g.157566 m.157566 type:complete len:55 (+) comp16311_c0_seq1:1339-1503(+)